MTNTIELNGFITNLGKYNEGELIGKWISFPISADELAEVFEEIGIDGERYEEYFFTDWDGDIDLYEIFGEYVNVEDVNELAERLEDIDDTNKLKAILDTETSDINEALDMMDRTELYEDMTLEDLAYQLVDDCYDLPEIAKTYFDYSAFARDLSFDGYTETEYGVLYCY